MYVVRRKGGGDPARAPRRPFETQGRRACRDVESGFWSEEEVEEGGCREVASWGGANFNTLSPDLWGSVVSGYQYQCSSRRVVVAGGVRYVSAVKIPAGQVVIKSLVRSQKNCMERWG